MLFSNVNEEEFELNREFEHKDVIYKEVRLKNRGCRCECGTFHKNVKEYKRKEILKLANGYSNFYRFRNRIMYSLNRYSDHSFPHD